MLSGDDAVHTVIDELRAKSWAVTPNAEAGSWTLSRAHRAPVTIRLPAGLLTAFLRHLVDDGLVEDLFGGNDGRRADSALGAYLAERLEEHILAAVAGATSDVVEVGIRMSDAHQPELYATRSDSLPQDLLRDGIHWTPHTSDE